MTSSQFAELEESIGYMVRNAHRAYDQVLAAALSKHKILTGQWSLLRVLWHEDNLSQIEVADRMKIERASLTIMLNTVEKAGLITRKIELAGSAKAADKPHKERPRAAIGFGTHRDERQRDCAHGLVAA